MGTQEKFRRSLFFAAALLVAGILAGGSVPAPALAVTPEAAPPIQHHAATPWVNPHLHLSAAAGHTPAPEVRPSETHTLALDGVRRQWHPVWDAHSYIVLHRGLGAVHGVVTSVSGQRTADARVALHKARGGVFRQRSLKHETHTSASGEFTMTNVRPGAYRVYAYLDSAHEKGFSPVHVEVGTVRSVAVSLPAAEPRK